MTNHDSMPEVKQAIIPQMGPIFDGAELAYRLRFLADRIDECLANPARQIELDATLRNEAEAIGNALAWLHPDNTRK